MKIYKTFSISQEAGEILRNLKHTSGKTQSSLVEEGIYLLIKTIPGRKEKR